MYFPDRGCVRTLRTLYVYASTPLLTEMYRPFSATKNSVQTVLPEYSTLPPLHCVQTSSDLYESQDRDLEQLGRRAAFARSVNTEQMADSN